MAKYAFCTIVTHSYLRYAVGLGSQLKRFHPEAVLNVLVIDPQGDLPRAGDLPVSVIRLSDIRIPNIDAMTIYFDAFELSNALKPFLIGHLLDQGFQQIIYLDSDIYVVGRFDEFIAVLDRSNFVLTPHVLTPCLDDVQVPTNVLIADRGIYNGGIWGISEHANARRALAWLKAVLPAAGFLDTAHGMFVDQKLLPFAAQLFCVGFEVFRNPGYNVAYWNLPERPIRKVGTQYFTEQTPVTFFHLSGFREDDCARFSKYTDRYTLSNMPILAEIITDYMHSLPQDWRLTTAGYAFDWHGDRRLTPGLRRHYFHTGTLAGYRPARFHMACRAIARAARLLLE